MINNNIHDESTKKLWEPGPGTGEDQVFSNYLCSRFLVNANDKNSYICTMYKEGFMYLEASGLEKGLIKEAEKAIK